MTRRKFTMAELESDPAAAASFLAAFIREQYGWDAPDDSDPELLSTATNGPLDIARTIAHIWVNRP